MGDAYANMEEKRYAYKFLEGKPEGKRPPGRLDIDELLILKKGTCHGSSG
jgi:hypothetical protein